MDYIVKNINFILYFELAYILNLGTWCLCNVYDSLLNIKFNFQWKGYGRSGPETDTWIWLFSFLWLDLSILIFGVLSFSYHLKLTFFNGWHNVKEDIGCESVTIRWSLYSNARPSLCPSVRQSLCHNVRRSMF